MNMLLNIIVLIFEVLYYSLFMKFCHREKKFNKYIINFIVVTIIGLFIKTDYFVSYTILILLILYSLKYIVKIKVELYDMLVIFAMLLFKFIIEIPPSLLIYSIIKDIYISSIIVGIIKVSIIILLRYKLNKIYNKMRKLWNKNNFYIRYIFSIFMFGYIIMSCIYIVTQWI